MRVAPVCAATDVLATILRSVYCFFWDSSASVDDWVEVIALPTDYPPRVDATR
jgi:hypothetical protein